MTSNLYDCCRERPIEVIYKLKDPGVNRSTCWYGCGHCDNNLKNMTAIKQRFIRLVVKK